MSPRDLWAKVISYTPKDTYSRMAHDLFVLFPMKPKAQYEADCERKFIGGAYIQSVGGDNVDKLTILTFRS